MEVFITEILKLMEVRTNSFLHNVVFIGLGDLALFSVYSCIAATPGVFSNCLLIADVFFATCTLYIFRIYGSSATLYANSIVLWIVAILQQLVIFTS